MIELSDVNRLSRFLFRGGVETQQQDPTGDTTRDDVVEGLVELRDMMNRMFARHPVRFI